jgi:hypothetical protein
LGRFYDENFRWFRLGGNGFQIFFSQSFDISRLDRARHYHDTVIRRIVGFEVSFQVRLFPVFHVVLIAYDRPVIRMFLESLGLDGLV